LGVGFCILIAYLRAGIGGTIVYEDDLIVVVILCEEAIYAFAEILLYSVYWNDDRQPWLYGVWCTVYGVWCMVYGVRCHVLDV
jgi:hypothetical protein